MADEEKNLEYAETVMQSEDQIEGGKPGQKGPYLIVVQGPRQGLKFPLIEGDNVIGRVMGSQVTLDDQSVSRKHSMVTQTREGWTVEDLGSKNGTYVNGRKISEKVAVGHGDIIQVGIYSLSIVTREIAKEDIPESLPSDWEGKTVMLGGKPAKPEEDTATMAEKLNQTQEFNAKSLENELSGKTDSGIRGEASEDKARAVPEIPQEEVTDAKKKRPMWWNIVLIGILVLVLGGAGAYGYFTFLHKPAKPVQKAAEPEIKVETPVTKTDETSAEQGEPTTGPVTTTPPATALLPTTIPVFLDFASSPLPASVTFQGQDYGTTPVKIQSKLDVGKSYLAEAVFDLQEVGEKYKEEVNFTVGRDDPLIPILFKGPIGVLKVLELPRGVELYLEGYFVYDPFTAKTAKLKAIVFGKPIYLPFGKYMIELRQATEVAGSGEYSSDIIYRREILVTEDNPVYELKLTDQDLNEYPIEILSIPTGADVFLDTKIVGKTPFKGMFPLGSHLLSLRKDGYFEHKEDLNVAKNSPVKKEVTLKTTKAGEFINGGKVLMQKGLYKEAISKLTEVFKNAPTPGETAQARYLIGSSFVHLGDFTAAEDYFKQSVEDPEMKHASLLGLVSVYHGTERRDQAIPPLVEVLLNGKEEDVVKEAQALFQQVSPLRSIIYIYSEPEGAKVYLNDKLMEQLTPLILPDLSLGMQKIRIEKDGYLPKDLNIKLSVNEFNPVNVKLDPKTD